jgi:predicted SprT family Zn-dependent metalloprotease
MDAIYNVICQYDEVYEFLGVVTEMQYNLKEKMSAIVKKYWDMDCTIPIHINARLKKTLGLYVYEEKESMIIPKQIQLSKEFVENADETVVEKVLKHEICHYILSIKKIPFLDGQKEFEEELIRINAPSEKSIAVEYKVCCNICGRHIHCRNQLHVKNLLKVQNTNCCNCSYTYNGVMYKLLYCLPFVLIPIANILENIA